MKKKYLPIIFLPLLLLLFIPLLTRASIVPSSCTDSTTCTITMFFSMLGNIYNLIVKDIAGPLAIIAVTAGAILMMVSAGNPNLMSLGKKIFYSAIIGLVLVLCSYLIIDQLLKAMGGKGLSSLGS